MTENDGVALVNLPLQSLWKHVEVYWQNRLVSSSDQYYPWKSILDVLTNYSEDSKETQLQSQLYFKDTASYMESCDPVLGGNFGLTQRFLWTKDGQTMDMEGPLYSDVFQQDSLLLNNVPVRIKLTPSSNQFRLMDSTGANCKVIVEDVHLWVCHAELNPDTYNDIAKKLQKDTAKYLYMKSEFFSHTMNAGTPSVRLDNLFQGRIPSQMIIVFVGTDAFTGSYSKNPFNFKIVP